MVFDFASYLGKIDPSVAYTIETLTGGVVNVTVRATKAAPALDAPAGRFPYHPSLIVKHAPPYIAGVGEEAPLTQTRQLVEAATLALFRPDATPTSLAPIARKSEVSTPELLLHDPSNHVLVLSDLGRLPDLSAIFSDLGGASPTSAAQAGTPTGPSEPSQWAPMSRRLPSDDALKAFTGVGERLGRFFGFLHDASMRREVLDRQPTRSPIPALPDMAAAVHEHAIKPILTHLVKFPALLDESEAHELFAAVEANFLRTTAASEQRLVLGDCWTGAVLVDLAPDPGRLRVAVIDWEFASTTGRGIDGDVSQLLAHLELLRLAAAARSTDAIDGHLPALAALADAFISTYAELSGIQEASGEQLMRSAFLSHGAEIIMCAIWKIWVCRDPTCRPCRRRERPVDDPVDRQRPTSFSSFPRGPEQAVPASPTEQTREPQCNLISTMIHRGVTFLRCAVAADPKTAAWRMMEDSRSQRLQVKGLCDLFLRPG